MAWFLQPRLWATRRVKIMTNDQIFCFNHGGTRISLFLPDPEDHIQKQIRRHGCFYEAPMLDDIRARLATGAVVVDVGACLGNHSVFFGLLCNAGKVHAFEPNAPSRRLLETNLALNGLTDKVRVYDCALGAQPGRGDVHLPKKGNLGMARVVEDPQGGVEVRTLDSVLQDTPRCDLIKIDVEGMELEVLKGARGLITRFRPLLYIECATAEQFASVSGWLASLGYRAQARFNDTPTYLFEAETMPSTEILKTSSGEGKAMKIAFFAGDSGNFHFAEGIIEDLKRRGHEVRVVRAPQVDPRTLEAQMRWSDISWFEWAVGPIVTASRMPKTCRIICRLHRMEVYSTAPREIDWRKVDDLIVVSPKVLSLLKDMHHPDIESMTRVHVIPNSIDLSRYSFAERRPGFKVAFLARFHSVKSPALMLQVISALVRRDPRYTCCVAGRVQDILEYQYFEHMVRAMGLEDHVVYEGHVDDVDAWLEDKQYLLSTSVVESQGVGIMEAMAKGIKPVIHNNLGDPSQVFDPRYVFNTVDEAVEMIVSEEYDSHAYRRLIEQRYDHQATLDRIHELIVSGRGGPKPEAVEENALGEAAFAEGDTERAVRHFEAALRLDPEFVDAWNNLGVAAWTGGDRGAALKCLLQGLQLDPCHREATLNAARVLSDLGKHSEAAELCELYLERAPDDAEIRALARAIPAGSAAPQPDGGASGRTEERPMFSVVIPTKDRPALLREALESLIAQSLESWEAVVVNDGGEPLGDWVLRLDPKGRIRCIHRPSSGGPSAARNEGLKAARGEYIAYLDDDDRFLPDHLATLAEAFRDPDVHVAYTEAEFVYLHRTQDGGTVEVSRSRPYSGIEYSRERLLVQNFIPMIVLAHRRSCLKEVGGFDESFPALVDWEFFLRLAERYRFHHIPRITVEARTRADERENVSKRQRSRFPQLFARIYARHSDGGDAVVRRARDEMLQRLFDEFESSRTPATAASVTSPGADEDALTAGYLDWRNRRQLDESDAQLMAERMMLRWRTRPSIHLLTVAQAGSEAALAATLEGLGQQLYKGWGLTVFSDAPMPQGLFDAGANLEWRQVGSGEFVESLNRCVEETGADWVAMLDPGDRLPPHALFSFADYINLHPEWRFIYCDSDLVDAEGSHREPRFLPDFNLELLRSTPYFGNFCLIERRALQAAGGLRGVPGVEAYDAALRILEQAGEGVFGHIPDVLFHQAQANRGLYTSEAVARTAREVVEAHLERSQVPAKVQPGLLPGSHFIEYLHEEQPLVSIIIPTKDRLDLLKPCVQSLLEKTSYPNYEVLVVDNASSDPATLEYLDSLAVGSARVRVLRYPHAYNFSAINNHAAREARGEYLLLLNNDTQIVQPQWLERMMAHAQRPEVGAVGARLVFPNQLVQHAGVVLGMGMAADHPFIGLPMREPGYLGRAQLAQNYSAVTAACLLTRRSVYEEVGGLDEERFKVLFNDVDYCLKVGSRGYKIVWTPFATVVHHGSSSLKSEAHQRQAPKEPVEALAMFDKWLPRLAADPAYNRNLSLRYRDMRVESRLVPGWNPDHHDRPRLLGHPLDAWGSGQYRVRAPLAALREAVLAQVTLVEQQDLDHIADIPEMARLAPDTILVQGFLHDFQLRALEMYRRYLPSTRLVYELDDLKTEMPASNPKARTMPADVAERLRRALSHCHRLVVSTEPLKEAYSDLIEDIVVVPNRLERRRWAGLRPQRRTGGRPRVGWAGAQQHHGDLAILREVVEATAGEVDWVFFGMCPPELRPHVKEFHEGVSFDRYPGKLASLNLDLAVAPLEINRFNEAKSNLRLLEYGIMGWPVVCTDIEPYRAHGAPVTRVQNRPEAWIEAIRAHAHDLDAAERAGEALRAWVLRHWMLEDHLDAWLAALTGLEARGAGGQVRRAG